MRNRIENLDADQPIPEQFITRHTSDLPLEERLALVKSAGKRLKTLGSVDAQGILAEMRRG